LKFRSKEGLLALKKVPKALLGEQIKAGEMIENTNALSRKEKRDP